MVNLEDAKTSVRVLREQLAEMSERLAAVADKSASPVGAMDLFENARGNCMACNYRLAVDGFAALLNASPQARNAALAKYYIGEAYRLDRKAS